MNFSASGLVAFIERNKAHNSAMVEIREPSFKNNQGDWCLGRVLENYETLSAGAAASARRSMKKLSQERKTSKA